MYFFVILFFIYEIFNLLWSIFFNYYFIEYISENVIIDMRVIVRILCRMDFYFRKIIYGDRRVVG